MTPLKNGMKKTGVNILRFYLATTSKLPKDFNKEKSVYKGQSKRVDLSDDDSLPDPNISCSGTSETANCILYEINVPPTLPEYIFDSETENRESVIEVDPEIVFNLDGALENEGVVNDNDSTLPYEAATPFPSIQIHRGLMSLIEMIGYFKDPAICDDSLSITRVLPNGETEKAEDSGGVLRDLLSEFWQLFYENCTLGRTVKVPTLRHDFGEEEWKSVARILVYGFRKTGYWPIQISKTFLSQCLLGHETFQMEELMNDFYNFVSVPDKEIFVKACSNFSEIDMDDLIEALDSHECKKIPKNDIFKVFF